MYTFVCVSLIQPGKRLVQHKHYTPLVIYSVIHITSSWSLDNSVRTQVETNISTRFQTNFDTTRDSTQ